MKTISGYTFPENKEEYQKWKPTIVQKALASNVLAVARTRCEGEWSAYIDAVPGKNHDNETDEVLRSGCKLLKDIAITLFPCFKDIPYTK